ncbi:general secretion pathway protein GspH [Shewanella sp. 10N.286.52.C2]|uniref:GspH/FimT family pseudopilin n=1 Tax=Shewanella sp. 10N.286.52.C2 TaxID=1880838 RepID=UPI000C85E616|nr:GspH/FimT family pseudopilin [Shewanella sp. 10N.286.52.C2]PMG31455.1 general secretion pathway protein GspH [Shewanella sp. 10N.286.52.C2]
MNTQLKGFNLIEVMVAVSIASIISTMAAPSLNNLINHARSKSNIRSIQQLIQLARNHAISLNARVTVCPIENNQCTNNWQQGFTIFIDGGESNIINTGDHILHIAPAFNPNDIVYYNRKAIIFQPDGLASGTNGTFRYCPEIYNSPFSKAVIVNQSGRIRFSRKNKIECKQN